MPRKKVNKADLTTEERICIEEKKIKKFFVTLDEEKKKFIEAPIHQLAVTQVILEKLSEEIAKGDVIELFEQGSQKMRRENPALKAYNTTIKSYSTLLKQLIELLPDTESDAAGKALMEFITQGKTSKKRG